MDSLRLDEVPPPNVCVIRLLLDRRASDSADQVFVRLQSGDAWTYTEVHARVRRAALGLRELGVRERDAVLSWLPNGPDALVVWFACNYLGAVLVPINVALRGTTLAHVIKDSGARLLIARQELVPFLNAVDCADLSDVITVGGDAEPPAGIRARRQDVLTTSDLARSLPDVVVEPWDMSAIIYTSGTAGRAKGVMCSYTQLYSHIEAWNWLAPTDRCLISLPMFHTGGAVPIYLSLLRGASIAFGAPFHVDTFWDDVRDSEATVTILLGAMANLLLKREPTLADRGHQLKRVGMVPLTQALPAFIERFGCNVFTWFSMTEVSVPIVSELNPSNTASCGRPRPGCDVRIADAHDRDVPVGQVGELLVRSSRPWGFSSGYFNNSNATADAWRNGWFHTGDAFRRDEAGDFYFVDRIVDTIRRRGENVSSTEVELEFLAHPDVLEAVAIGVPAENGDQEILAVVRLMDGREQDPVALTRFLIPRMPHFMLPKYIRFVTSIPKTETQKPRKAQLRGEGVTDQTWDREAAGILVRSRALT